MAITVTTDTLQRRDTTANWNSANPVLGDKILGYEVDASGKPVGMKMGNGATAWVNLPYWFVWPFGVSFAAVSTVTINWQTDTPPGRTGTYAQLFGNQYPAPMVFDNADIKQDFTLIANRATPGDITTNLTTVVFNFPVAITGTIQF